MALGPTCKDPRSVATNTVEFAATQVLGTTLSGGCGRVLPLDISQASSFPPETAEVV